MRLTWTRAHAAVALTLTFAVLGLDSSAQSISTSAGVANNGAGLGSAASTLQGQIDALRQSENALQGQISKLLRAGTATAPDLLPLYTALRQKQVERQAAEEQQFTQQQAERATKRSAQASGVANFGGVSGAALDQQAASAPQPLSQSPAFAALPPAQQAIVMAKRDLYATVKQIKEQHPGDSQAIVDALAQWQAANTATIVQADRAMQAQNAASKAKALARLQSADAGVGSLQTAPATAADAGSIANSSAASVGSVSAVQAVQAVQAAPVADATLNLPPKMQALFQAQKAADQELQIIMLQTGNSTPEARRAALLQWQASHSRSLAQLQQEARTEAKALEAAAEAKAAALGAGQ